MEISMLYDARARIETAPDDSHELVRRAQTGDAGAFGEIFERHHRFVFKFIYALTGDQARAEELTQETFLGAFRGIGNLRGEAALRTWLCGIAKNTVYKSHRRTSRETGNTGEEIESLDIADAKTRTPDAEFLNKELNERIRRALERLDPDKRLVFALREFQHLSYQEISEITGFTVAKLKTDLHRAKAEMRELLRPYLENDR